MSAVKLKYQELRLAVSPIYMIQTPFGIDLFIIRAKRFKPNHEHRKCNTYFIFGTKGFSLSQET